MGTVFRDSLKWHLNPTSGWNTTQLLSSPKEHKNKIGQIFQNIQGQLSPWKEAKRGGGVQGSKRNLAAKSESCL